MNDIVFAGKHFLTYSVSRHKHKSWELVYCTGRSGRFIFDDTEIPYGAGDIVIIPPDTPHKNVSEEGFTNIHLNIDKATLPQDKPSLIKDDANGTILHLFSDAHYLFSSDLDQKAEFLTLYGSLIVRFITVMQSDSQKSRIAEQIEQSIVQNFADANYKLDEALSSMPYCEDYLCRVFRREKGSTPHQFLTNLRLQAAASMLHSVYASSSVTEIARLSGFRNPLYFSRLFKKKYGVSPREYAQHSPDAAAPDTISEKISLPE